MFDLATDFVYCANVQYSSWAIMAILKLFFSTDIHGSEKTFVKFLNSAKFYGVKILIMGGDITGKMVVPLVSQSDGSYKTTFLGSDVTAKTEDDLVNLEKQIRFNGFYPYRTDPKELEELKNHSGKVDELFSRLMVEATERWVRMAEDRLQKSGIRCFITPGNDDRFQVDGALAKSNYVVNPEGKVIDLEGYEMISTGYSNRTPFNAPREEDEEIPQHHRARCRVLRPVSAPDPSGDDRAGILPNLRGLSGSSSSPAARAAG